MAWNKLCLCFGIERLLMASLLVLIFASAFSHVQPCNAFPTIQDTTEHLPAANLIFMDRKKGLQVITLPATDAMDPKIELRSVGVKKPFGKPIGVYGAHLITLDGHGAFKQGLHATDLYDGTVRILVEADVIRAAYSSEHLYYILRLPKEKRTKNHAFDLHHIDLATLKSSLVCPIADVPHSMGVGIALHVSPDGETAAVIEMHRASYRDPFVTARVVFAKPGQTETVASKYAFPAIQVSNGAGIFDYPPKFSWLDNKTLLFASHASGFHPGDFGPQTIRPEGEPQKISAIKSSDGSHRDVCDLPDFSSPIFVGSTANHDGKLIVCLRSKGLVEIDLDKGNHTKTMSLGNTIQLRGTDQPNGLPLDSSQIEFLLNSELLNFDDSGNRVAWFSKHASFRTFGIPDKKDNLYVYDPIMGKQVAVETEIGLMFGHDAHVSLNPLFFWATEQELERAEHLKDLPTTVPLERKPK